MLRTAIAGLAALCSSAAMADAPGYAIVTHDQTALRAAARGSAQQHSLLWQGELVEVRGARADYLQVYEHRRERAGYVHSSQLRSIGFTPAHAAELLAVVRFLRDTHGAEALGIGFAAAFIKAAPAPALAADAGIEVMDALGTFADRLAQRASSGVQRSKSADMALAAHLEVVARYGVGFRSFERNGRMQICYEGEAFRRVLAMNSSAEQRASAALALTREECADPDLGPLERNRLDEWRAEVLDAVDAAQVKGFLKQRLHVRRAALWASLAFQRARKGEGAQAAATRALAELAAVDRSDLPDEDASRHNDAAMRVGASRWAAVPAPAATISERPSIVASAGQPGETCVALVSAANGSAKPLAGRCTYGVVWTGSASLNREGSALAVAVQPTDGWRELWVFRKSGEGWTIGVLPPAAVSPGIGYVEHAGWVPGGKQMLVAREARGDGKYRRSFEVVNVETLIADRQASDPASIAPFQRWQDPAWKRTTVSVRHGQ